MPASLRVVQICLFLFAAIGLFGGSLQMYLGQPETTPRLDNIHRFLAGIYLGAGFICAVGGHHRAPAGHPRSASSRSAGFSAARAGSYP